MPLPRRFLERAYSGLIACIPAHADSRRRKIDVFRVTLGVEPRRQQSHNVHLGWAPIAGELFHSIAVARFLGYIFDKLIYDVTQLMRLLLSRDMTRDTAGILDVFVSIEHFQDVARHGADWVPEMDRKNKRAPARIIV